MNTNIARVWAAALRSGHYKQGRLHLKRHDCYCVVGVLCELWRLDDPEHRHWVTQDPSAPYRIGNEGVVLPDEVREWAGLQTVTAVLPSFMLYGEVRRPVGSLVAANDLGMSFEKMADLIDRLGELL